VCKKSLKKRKNKPREGKTFSGDKHRRRTENNDRTKSLKQ